MGGSLSRLINLLIQVCSHVQQRILLRRELEASPTRLLWDLSNQVAIAGLPFAPLGLEIPLQIRIYRQGVQVNDFTEERWRRLTYLLNSFSEVRTNNLAQILTQVLEELRTSPGKPPENARERAYGSESRRNLIPWAAITWSPAFTPTESPLHHQLPLQIRHLTKPQKTQCFKSLTSV